MKHLLLLLLVGTTCWGANRQITEFASVSGKYLVVSKPIDIAKNDTLTIPQGREVLFAALCGIIVDSGATLLALGSNSQPITFTSIQDTANGAGAFDWVGIDIKKGATANFSYCLVAFSSSGITADDSTGVTIDKCVFSSNGQWNVSIAGTVSKTPDLQPFTFATMKPSDSTKKAVDLTPKISTSPQPKMGNPAPRLGTRTLVFAGMGILLSATSITAHILANQKRTEYENFVPGNSTFDQTEPSERQNNFDKMRKDYNIRSLVGLGSLGLAIADFAVLALTIRF